MFDIGWSELVVIGVVALIAIGPKELPTVLRSVGHWIGKVRRMATEFQGQFQEALREAEVADLKKQADDLSSKMSSYTHIDPLADVQRSMEAAVAAEPATPASPPPIDVPPTATPPVRTEDFAPPTTPEPPKTGGSGT